MRYRFEDGSVGPLPQPNEWRPELTRGFPSHLKPTEELTQTESKIVETIRNIHLRPRCDNVAVYSDPGRLVAVFTNPNHHRRIKLDTKYPFDIDQLKTPFFHSLIPDHYIGQYWHRIQLKTDQIDPALHQDSQVATKFTAEFPRLRAKPANPILARILGTSTYALTGLVMFRIDIASIQQRIDELEHQVNDTVFKEDLIAQINKLRRLNSPIH